LQQEKKISLHSVLDMCWPASTFELDVYFAAYPFEFLRCPTLELFLAHFIRLVWRAAHASAHQCRWQAIC